MFGKIKLWIISHKNFVLAMTLILINGISGVLAYKAYVNFKNNYTINSASITKKPTPTQTPSSAPTEAPKAIAKNPPKHSSSGMKGRTTTNRDGTKTTTVGEGTYSQDDYQAALSACPSGSSPSTIDFLDRTRNYPNLGNDLKSYIGSNLRYSSEVPAMCIIIVKDAGASGWAGQYWGSYTQNAQGKIVSSWGFIILNVYYYKGSPYFTDYMKLVLSHEYGHHYTLYHKWLAWNLGIDVRFPDAYYNVRPLSKATTAIDYSKGWGNCEAEIIAEDYSYLYSGYGYHAMSSTYGYPSDPGTRSFINNLPSGGGSPPSDNPPTVSITLPANGATISGTTAFTANASDDIQVTKVGFYVDTTLIVEDNSAPYATNVNTTGYSNGAHTLKAIAYDSSHNTTATISVTINNPSSDTENPVAEITQPNSNPYTWSADDLIVRARGTDNVGVVKVELYVNDILAASVNASSINARWEWEGTPAGSYTLKAKVYDAAGNTGETSITVNKTG